MRQRPTLVAVREGLAFGLIMLAAAPRAVFGQAATDSACTYDTVAAIVDTVTFAAVAPRHDSTYETMAEYAFRVEQAHRVTRFLAGIFGDSVPEIAEGMVPDSVTDPPRAADSALTALRDSILGAPPDSDLASGIWFQVNDSGRLSGARMVMMSDDSLVNTALVRAVVAADSARALAPLPESMAGDPVDLWLELMPLPDTTGAIVLSASALHGLHVTTVLVRPGYHGPLDQVPVQTYHPPIRYPQAAWDYDAADTVTLRFVIDPAGKPDPQSIHVEASRSSAFLHAARWLVRNSRYRPARILGCPVYYVVEQQVVFVPPR
ncbi:MAG TPA: energy transducer TonB [Gemmatimonadales bacterium]|nr:energy transducer TonB [Gemmatimonadales bacterium]